MLLFFWGGDPEQQWGCWIAQCSTGLKSGIGLEQHQTGSNQTRSGRNSLFYMYMYIYSVYTVGFLESWLAANCRDSVTLLLKHKAGPFIYLSWHNVNFIPHPHSHLYCTSSTCICVWNMHDTYITRRGLSEDGRFFPLVCSEKQWFQRRDVYLSISSFRSFFFNRFRPVITFSGPGAQAVRIFFTIAYTIFRFKNKLAFKRMGPKTFLVRSWWKTKITVF